MRCDLFSYVLIYFPLQPPVKRFRYHTFVVPEWEAAATTDFSPLAAVERFATRQIQWKHLPGARSVAAVTGPSSDSSMVESLSLTEQPSQLLVRDPDTFRAGELHNHPEVWDSLSAHLPNKAEIMRWIKHRVSIREYWTHFRGDFAGVTYNSDIPVPRIFQNNVSCKPFIDFISRTICDRIGVGAVAVIGRVRECAPPLLVTPLTVEPTKPRLCQDQRYLNLWMKDMPFSLDSAVDLTRYVDRDHYQTKLDDKSGYDHVLMDDESRLYMGFQWGGWWFINNVLPFGWKISPYVYQTLGMVATQELRRQHIPCSQYIDDRHLGQRRLPRQPGLPESTALLDTYSPSSFIHASQSVSIAISLLASLGYFLNLSKSVIIPVQRLVFLGLVCDSTLLAFLLPPDKIQQFSLLRENILSQKQVTIVTLQKLIGKCVSFSLVVPAAKLFTREMNIAMTKAMRSRQLVPIRGPLREEILYWRFLDQWTGHMCWRQERHLTMSVASDASGSGWGGTLLGDQGCVVEEVRDSWVEPILSQPIHVKETVALSRTLVALAHEVRNHRVDVYVDSRILLDCWQRQYTRSQDMLSALKELFWVTVQLNVVLSLKYVPTTQNPADAPSRRFSDQDCSLSPRLWLDVQQIFGGVKGHTIDLMALDSNTQCDVHGNPLPHFSPVANPGALAVNLFSQTISADISPIFNSCYVFPPFLLIAPVLRFLCQQKARCTIIVPDRYPRKYWWPILSADSVQSMRIAQQGETDVLLRPTKNGVVEYGPIPWDLWAFRLLYA